jgi:hypothetical protein
MRNLGLISGLALASVIAMYACTLEPTPDPGQQTGDPSGAVNPQAPSSDEATADESLGTTSDAVITPNSCLVTLNFCDKLNSPIGTDCTESGCSLSTAISACKSLVSKKGCVQHCNAVMRQGTGQDAPIIKTWRFTCGSTCCPEGTAYCGPHGACCDGVHFNSQCPPL